jgi:uncharacterized protein (TIGR02117 family)
MLRSPESGPAIRALWRGLRIGALAFAALVLAAGLAILAGALPYRAGTPAAEGAPVAIYVVTNGFHTDIVVPTLSEAKDWRPLLQASPITRQSLDAPWLAFGWGSQAAYTELGTLADLSVGLALKAVAFDRSVVHVQPVVAILAGEEARRFTVTQAGYQRLVAHIERSLQPGADGAPVVLPDVTHGTGDAFLRGRDRFWLLRSCNVWVGEALRKAGLPVGLWTPLARSLMWSLGPGDGPERQP